MIVFLNGSDVILREVLTFFADEEKGRLCVASSFVARAQDVWRTQLVEITGQVRPSSGRSTRSDTCPRRAFFSIVKLRILLFTKMREEFRNKRSWQMPALKVLCEKNHFLLRSDTVVRRYRAFLGDSIYTMALGGLRGATLRTLLEGFPDINVNTRLSENGLSALGVFAWAGQADMVKFLLDLNRKRVSTDSTASGLTAQSLDLNLRGVPPKTSYCGGKKPYSAMEWCERKLFLAKFFGYADSIKMFSAVKKLLVKAGCDAVERSVMDDLLSDFKFSFHDSDGYDCRGEAMRAVDEMFAQ